jgi:hypothetical protein
MHGHSPRAEVNQKDRENRCRIEGRSGRIAFNDVGTKGANLTALAVSLAPISWWSFCGRRGCFWMPPRLGRQKFEGQ